MWNLYNCMFSQFSTNFDSYYSPTALTENVETEFLKNGT